MRRLALGTPLKSLLTPTPLPIRHAEEGENGATHFLDPKSNITRRGRGPGGPAAAADYGYGVDPGWGEWVTKSLREIEKATVDDAEAVIGEFTIAEGFTETRTLDAATATLTDLANFVATLVSDIKKKGQKRTHDES